MRKPSALVVIGASLFLVGCGAVATTTPAVTPGVIDPAPISVNTDNTTVSSVVSGVQKACSYVPDSAMVSTLLSMFAPEYKSVGVIVSDICAAVNVLKTPRGRTAGAVLVRGAVPLQGHFVR